MKILKLLVCSIILIFVDISSRKTRRKNKNCQEIKVKYDQAFRAVSQAVSAYKSALRNSIEKKDLQLVSGITQGKTTKKTSIGSISTNLFRDGKDHSQTDQLLDVVNLDWDEEITDVLRLAKVLRVLKLADNLDENVLESFKREKELDAFRRDIQKDDELRITRRLKTINRANEAQKLFNSLREVRQSELNQELERAETALEEVKTEALNCQGFRK